MVSFLKACSLSLIVVFMSQSALADWSSGGGIISRDGGNPWWLFNTKNINYCIQIDESNFGLSREIAHDRIEQALQYWKESFQNQDYDLTKSLYPTGIGIASQNFKKIDSCHNAQLRFQLGYLSKAQQKEIGTPWDYVGLAKRENYNLKTLSGSGYIYISPQSGALKMRGANIMDKPWDKNDGALLTLVLIHELGHVFGVQHGEALWPNGPELFVSKQLGPVYANLKLPVGNHFSFSKDVRCGNPNLPLETTSAFNLASDTQCIEFDYNRQSSELEVSTFQKTSESIDTSLIPKSLKIPSQPSEMFEKTIEGHIKVVANPAHPAYTIQIWVFFPKGQKVVDKALEETLYGVGGISSRNFISYYIAADGEFKKQMEISLTTAGISFGQIGITALNKQGELYQLEL